jgi:hypothetical protein
MSPSAGVSGSVSSPLLDASLSITQLPLPLSPKGGASSTSSTGKRAGPVPTTQHQLQQLQGGGSQLAVGNSSTKSQTKSTTPTHIGVSAASTPLALPLTSPAVTAATAPSLLPPSFNSNMSGKAALAAASGPVEGKRTDSLPSATSASSSSQLQLQQATPASVSGGGGKLEDDDNDMDSSYGERKEGEPEKDGDTASGEYIDASMPASSAFGAAAAHARAQRLANAADPFSGSPESKQRTVLREGVCVNCNGYATAAHCRPLAVVDASQLTVCDVVA